MWLIGFEGRRGRKEEGVVGRVDGEREGKSRFLFLVFETLRKGCEKREGGIVNKNENENENENEKKKKEKKP